MPQGRGGDFSLRTTTTKTDGEKDTTANAISLLSFQDNMKLTDKYVQVKLSSYFFFPDEHEKNIA